MYSLPKNKIDDIRISQQNYKGIDLIDIRIFKKTRNNPEGIRTYRGISIRPGLLEPFIDTLTRFNDELVTTDSNQS